MKTHGFQPDPCHEVYGFVATAGYNPNLTIEVYRLEAGRWNVDLVGLRAMGDWADGVSRTRIAGAVTYNRARSVGIALARALASTERETS